MQRLCALHPHGGAGCIPTDVLNFSVPAVAQWGLGRSGATTARAVPPPPQRKLSLCLFPARRITSAFLQALQRLQFNHSV